MNKKLYIATSCTISNSTIFIDGQPIIKESQDLSFPQFAKKVYKDNGMKYSKFFKMDKLSKLAFLGAEFLFQKSNFLSKDKENKVAIVLSNRAASLETDRKHQASIEDKAAYYPSPAVFVYTLPNIGIGEISIRHKLYSENAFFVFDEFNATFLANYSESLIYNQKENSVLCGWVEYDGTEYHAFLYLVSETGIIPHTVENIENLFNRIH